jgi:peptidyl-prolyl cis-trans isomerase B (cyclophilin B)
VASRLLVLLLALALGLSACGGDDDSEGAAETTQAEQQAGGAEEAGCEKAQAPKAKKASKRRQPKLELDRNKTYVAKILTSCGTFQITLDVKRAPKTAASFVSLARDGFFDMTTFHRVARGFVIQGGDPRGDGTGGPGYSVVEKPPSDLQYTRGVVAMAKTLDEKPGTSGSQFFVVTGEDAGLPPDYALLGEVTKGLEVVDRIAVVETVPPDDGEPTSPIVIRQVTVDES